MLKINYSYESVMCGKDCYGVSSLSGLWLLLALQPDTGSVSHVLWIKLYNKWRDTIAVFNIQLKKTNSYL
jgi:hypothetical protein